MTDSGVTIAPGSATSVVFNSVTREFFAAMRSHGIYSSSDGLHWTRLANQPGAGLSAGFCPANPSSSSCAIYRGEIAAVPGRNEMYVWYVDGNETNQGIWKTTSGGASWTQLDDTGITNCGDSFGGCGTQQGFYNLQLAAVPNGASATDLYAGAINLYKCTLTSLSHMRRDRLESIPESNPRLRMPAEFRIHRARSPGSARHRFHGGKHPGNHVFRQ